MGKDKNSWEILVTQLREYRAGKAPYNAPYLSGYDNPITWWSSCESNRPYIQTLALKLFAIIPQSTGCERNFSNLGFFYGKRCQKMHLHTLESLAKVFCYNVSNADHVLRFSNFQHAQTSLEEIQEMIHNSFGDLDNNEDNEVEVTDLITKLHN